MNVGVEYRVILGGLRNPRTTSTTSSFQITSYDDQDYKIEFISTGLTVEMTSYQDLTSFTVTQSNGINGANSNYLFAIKAAIPIIS